VYTAIIVKAPDPGNEYRLDRLLLCRNFSDAAVQVLLGAAAKMAKIL
jgi:hypothetical protein